MGLHGTKTEAPLEMEGGLKEVLDMSPLCDHHTHIHGHTQAKKHICAHTHAQTHNPDFKCVKPSALDTNTFKDPPTPPTP